MCGIAGLIWKDAHRPADAARVEEMCRLMWHRGPDDGGLFTDRNVALGHRRLAIIDLSPAGRQPMQSTDGRFTVVFNGEIYNYRELRDDLAVRGAAFRTNTDTEVLLEAYRRWGAECVSRFNGMWAFAVYDSRERTVFLSRDRIGVKPLYYTNDGDAFCFASEIKAILGIRPKYRRPNRPYLARFLRTSLRDGGTETAFQGVQSLPAAHNAVYDAHSGRLHVQRYWDLDPERAGTVDAASAPEQLHALLESSIRLHLRSDVPVGTCLSGGLDSSTLVGMAAAQTPNAVHTFSGMYLDRDCNEQPYVEAVNRHADTRPHPVRPAPDGDLLDDLRTITWHQDEPTAAPGLYTQLHVMRAARHDVTVLLDGQGGDELFAGYLFFFNARIGDLIRANPLAGRWQALRLLLEIRRHWGLATAAEGWNRLLGGSLGWLRRFVPRPRSAGRNVLSEELLRQYDGDEMRLPEPSRFTSSLDQFLYEQVTATSLPTLLHYEDRNSMAYSLEARVPLLDHRVVEFAFSVSPNARLHGSWTKWCLRKVAERHVPHEVAWRRSKMGYPTPIDRWLRQPPDRDAAADALFSPAGFDHDVFDERSLRRLWSEQQAGANHGWVLYRVLTTQLWFRQSIDAWQPHPARVPQGERSSVGRTVFRPRQSA
ncbi:MAG: asparagine synthase (glutamine-hydrolyzing) [Planctomycetaceae bacterium]